MDKFKAQIDEFEDTMEEFEEKLRRFSQGVRTLRSNITNLSTDVDRLHGILLERIVEKSEKLKQAEQIKADNERAKEIYV